MSNPIKILFTVLLLATAQLTFAQKAELITLCNNLIAAEKSGSGMYVHYHMIMEGKGEFAGKDSMEMKYFLDKKKDGFKMLMGDYQEVVKKGKLAFTVVHPQKRILVQQDTSKGQTAIQLTEILSSVESAKKVEKKGKRTYRLVLENHPMYDFIDLTFSKTGKLSRVYSLFKTNYPEPYKSLDIVYYAWDDKWQAEEGFPNMENYAKKKKDVYVGVGQFSKYRIVEPKEQNVKLDLRK